MPIHEYGTLYIPDANATGTGRHTTKYQKGCTPHNKGKKWGEFLGKRAQKKCAKGWGNLTKYRVQPMTMPDVVAKRSKPVIAVFPDGAWKWYANARHAAESLGGARTHICQVCNNNLTNAPTRYKGNNTDHAHKGVRFYYETDNNWLNKIKQE